MDELKSLAGRAPKKYKALYLNALRGKIPPRSAIKVKCLECVCWQRMEGGRDNIKDCAVRSCPLWSLRPFQRQKRVRAISSVEVTGGAV